MSAAEIFARRIAQRNHPGDAQRLGWPHRDNKNAKTFGLKFFDHRCGRRRRLGNRRDDREGPLDDPHWLALGVDCRSLRHLSRGIERREGDELPTRHIRRLGSRADGGVQGVGPAIGARQCRHRQDLRLVESRQRVTGGDREFIACQRPGLVGAQNIHPGRFIERREARRQTPRCATAPAPTVAASVNIAGSATGIEARRATSTSGTICASGIAK